MEYLFPKLGSSSGLVSNTSLLLMCVFKGRPWWPHKMSSCHPCRRSKLSSDLLNWSSKFLASAWLNSSCYGTFWWMAELSVSSTKLYIGLKVNLVIYRRVLLHVRKSTEGKKKSLLHIKYLPHFNRYLNKIILQDTLALVLLANQLSIKRNSYIRWKGNIIKVYHFCLISSHLIQFN